MRTLEELLESSVADLPDALACDAEQRSDFLKRPLLAVVEAVIQVEDLPLALCQVALEHRLEEVPTGDRFDVLLDIGGHDARELLSETRAEMPVRSANREQVPYSNTNGRPSAKSPLTMITLTKPIERKGWRPTSVTRRRKPTPEDERILAVV